MRYSKPFMMIFMLLLTLMVSAFCVSAQDIDVEGMSNEELLLLLQEIMQKLEQRDNAGETATPVPEILPTSQITEKTFSIYRNKKTCN